MSGQQALAAPEGARAPRGAARLRLSGIVHRVFPERHDRVFAMKPELARALVEHFGHGAEAETYLAGTGNSFITMSEGLLDELPEPPVAEVVLLAYHSPDLYRSEVAGCYLAQRLPGAAIPSSVTGPGPGAMFQALRLAEGMCRLGELDQGVLFGYDQNAVVWEAEDPAHRRPDAAVLLRLGARGELAVAELADVPAGVPDAPSLARALTDALDRHPDARVLVGAGLAAALGGLPPGRVVETVTELWSTGVWAAVARLWPLREPVLLADFEPVAGRLHTALLVPEDGS
jgi:hypothetical protein